MGSAVALWAGFLEEESSMLFAKSWYFIVLFVLIASGASANPLAGIQSSAMDRLKKSQSGLSLLGGESFDPPNFSGQNGLVRFYQTRSADEQAELKAQRGPRLTYASSAPTHSHGDNWRVGNGWIGAGLEYLTQGNNDGDTFSNAYIRTTVLGQHTILLGANVTTRRQYGSQTTLNDDRLKYTVKKYYLGQATPGPQGSIPLGQRFQPEHDYITETKIYQQKYRYVIGVVPILLRLGLSGKFSTGRPYSEIGLAPGTLDEIKYEGHVRPYGSLTGYGDASILGDVPDNLKPGDVQVHADVNFITGAVQATAHGDSKSVGPCLRTKLDDLLVLNAVVYARAWWSVLQTAFVKTFVTTVCNNDWFSIPGCSQVEQLVNVAEQWLSFDHQEEIFRFKGFKFNNDWYWLDRRYCEDTLPTTRLRMCNQNSKDIYAAHGHFDKASNQWNATGWWKIPANGCYTLALGNYEHNKVYVYAEYGGGQVVWAGSGPQMCIDKASAFKYPEGFSAGQCTGVHQKLVTTSEVNVTPNGLTTWNFGAADPSAFDPRDTLIRLCNDMPEKNWAVIRFGGRTRGWYEMEANACRDVNLKQYAGEVHIHAAAGDRRWGIGDSTWCVDSLNQFDFADSSPCSNLEPGSKLGMRKFYTRIVPQGTVHVERFETGNMQVAKFACNDTNRTLRVAYGLNGIYDPNVTDWKSKGWQSLKPNQCLEYACTYPHLYETYVFAETEDSGQVFEWVAEGYQMGRVFPYKPYGQTFEYGGNSWYTPAGAIGNRVFRLAPDEWIRFGDHNKKISVN